MCTSLTYTDASGAAYVGRTIELNVGEPYAVAYVPAGQAIESVVEGHPPVTYTTTRSAIAITAPGGSWLPGQPVEPNDLKVSEGLNDAGLTVSLNAYPTMAGDEPSDRSQALLQAVDLGAWALGQFSTVAEVKEALKDQPIYLSRLALAGNIVFPMHARVCDQTGGSIVIQWNKGEMQVFDDPVGVLTNAPEFPWYLTYLGYWTHLDNVDRSSATFGSLKVNQPDSGIATVTLPSDDTAIGRYVRAAYYGRFVEKESDPDAALISLARIMNRFDRPRGATEDLPSADGAGVTFAGTGQKEGAPSTEFTAVTVLSDTARGRFLVRAYEALNYSTFDLGRLSAADGVRIEAVARLDPLGGDATDLLLKS